MDGFLHEAVTFLLRWLHVVAAIAWIGESFYFVALDRALQPPKNPQPGLHGELWSVHGGGFYHKQKYLPAPAELPDDLHWSKWKSYTTWLSGFALLAVLYLASPTIYLLDPAVAALSPAQGVAAAIGLLLVGWIGYDLLCRAVGFRDQLLGLLVAVLVFAIAFVATHLFAGRAAFLLTGATLATIMSANVFFVIIPGQKRMVAALARGETPDPLPGQRGKQRSVHNTYFTLPVVFAMLAIHYPAAWAHPYNWLLLALFMAAAALIRQFFVLWHSGNRAWWLVAVGTGILGLAFWLMAPTPRPALAESAGGSPSGTAGTGPSMAPASAGTDVMNTAAISTDVISTEVVATAAVMPIIERHCNACHSATPKLMPSAPKGVLLDRAEHVEAHAAAIAQQTVVLRIMPPGNMTGISDEERALLGRWARGQAGR